MTIFNVYVFNRYGACLYYHEWMRPHNPLSSSPDEDRKLMFGLVFSLKGLMNKMNPVDAPAASGSGAPVPPPPPSTHAPLPPAGPDQGFFRYTTPTYVLHHLETLTGYKFVVTSDAAAGDLHPFLWRLYADAFVGYALKNPLYSPGTPIECTGFARAVDEMVRDVASKRAALPYVGAGVG